jgi:hypothetical protein
VGYLVALLLTAAPALHCTIPDNPLNSMHSYVLSCSHCQVLHRIGRLLNACKKAVCCITRIKKVPPASGNSIKEQASKKKSRNTHKEQASRHKQTHLVCANTSVEGRGQLTCTLDGVWRKQLSCLGVVHQVGVGTQGNHLRV